MQKQILLYISVITHRKQNIQLIGKSEFKIFLFKIFFLGIKRAKGEHSIPNQ